MPDGHTLPRRLVGREAIRTGVEAFHREPAFDGTVNVEDSTYVLRDYFAVPPATASDHDQG